ncbi:MAG: Fic family protein [Candidatus Pacebacteria bacterium]|nr:Fic family protein [Candidatus Paceibacterota bacterium]
MNKDNNKFKKRLTNLDEKIWELVARIDETKGKWSAGSKLTPSTLTTLRQSVLITSAGASTRIEGSCLSDEEVEKIMRGLSVTKFRERDVQEVQGYLEVLQNTFDGFETLSLREGVIQHLHKELLQYSEKDVLHRGKYKQKENIVGIQNEKGEVEEIIFETTPAWLVQKEMTEIVEWTHQELDKKEIHPLLVIGNFLVEFLKIHPFEDGNGRLSRVLTNILLLRAGYLYMPYVSHEQIVEHRKEEYYLALRQSQATFKTAHESVEAWLIFFLNVVLKQGTQAILLLESEQLEDILSPKQLKIWDYISGVDEASAGDIAKNTGIARPTVNQGLEKLLRLTKIKRIGQGRAVRYQKLT